MQIRRNTKAFKSILEIVTSCSDRADRQELIRLYITRAGQSIDDRIAIEGNKSEATFFYDLGYQAVLNNLNSSNHQLYQSDDIPGIYFFRSTLSKAWDEAPFEFDNKIKGTFTSLPGLPVTRDKGKEKEFVLPATPAKTETGKAKPVKKEKGEKAAPAKATMFINRGPKQPDYRLRHEIGFTDLDRISFRQPQLTKKDVLDYYNNVADYLLPYLKDRKYTLKPKKEIEETPSWIKGNISDKEHLLFYAEHGSIQFDAGHAKKNTIGSPDYSIIAIDSGSEFGKAINVARSAKEIFDGLSIPAFAKTDGVSGLHVYIPLDGSSTFGTSARFAEYICKLIRLKIPDLVTIHGHDEYSYGKVTLDFSINEDEKNIVTPYSLVVNTAALVATPVSWEEIAEGFKPEDLSYETVINRLKKDGDPMEGFMKKKINADEMVETMETYYSFLF